jgi:hypothetical protein
VVDASKFNMELTSRASLLVKLRRQSNYILRNKRLTFVIFVVALDQVSLALKREKLLLVSEDLKLLFENMNLVSDFVLGCTLNSLVLEVPLVPHIKGTIERLDLIP